MKTLVKWTSDLATGNETVDQQHQELFAQIDAFLTACAENLGAAQIGLTLAFLESYVNFHFEAEEAYMDSIDYPRVVEHKAMHASFLRSFNDLKQQLGEFGPTESVQRLARETLLDWLVNHIEKVDKELVACEHRH